MWVARGEATWRHRCSTSRRATSTVSLAHTIAPSGQVSQTYALHMVHILEISEARVLSVASRLSVILCRWLSVHLEQPASRLSDHAPHQINVVDGACRSGSLVGLVDALEGGGQEALGFTDDLGGLDELRGGDAGNFGDIVGRVLLDDLLEVVELANALNDRAEAYQPCPTLTKAIPPTLSMYSWS